VRLQTKDMENDSTLLWDPPADDRATGYDVLWRATAAPDWEHSQRIDKVSKAMLPVSKDNVIFGVQAVDEAGHRSRPVVPSPER
jgi:hypothetical protein